MHGSIIIKNKFMEFTLFNMVDTTLIRAFNRKSPFVLFFSAINVFLKTKTLSGMQTN